VNGRQKGVKKEEQKEEGKWGEREEG